MRPSLRCTDRFTAIGAKKQHTRALSGRPARWCPTPSIRPECLLHTRRRVLSRECSRHGFRDPPSGGCRGRGGSNCHHTFVYRRDRGVCFPVRCSEFACSVACWWRGSVPTPESGSSRIPISILGFRFSSKLHPRPDIARFLHGQRTAARLSRASVCERRASQHGHRRDRACTRDGSVQK